jgi:signal transduction histidine kinase
MAIAQGVKNLLTVEREREELRRLAELDRLKDEFLSGVSHELRTPLAALKGFVQLVLLDWDDMPADEKKELLRRGFRNAEDLTRLVEQLLDFSRLAEDRIKLAIRPMPLAPLIDELVERLSSVLSSHTVDVAVPKGLRVDMDPHAFERIMTNLLANAVKFSPPGGTVSISTEQAGDEVTVTVADQGRGIPAEHHDLVFERFFQSGPPSSSRRGTGIGLAIVRRYVELLGGHVWVKSESGAGAAFSFTLHARS